jgi:hypothetical protein
MVGEATDHTPQELYCFATLLKRGLLTISTAGGGPNFNRGTTRSAGGLERSGVGPRSASPGPALYTREAAYFSFEEKDRGTLTEGKCADMVVLDKDPMHLPPEAIPNCRVKMTLVGGKIVYDGR